MPTLIVEDGTGVVDANSYIDLAYLESYAEDRGFTLPSTDEAKEILVVKAMDYIERKNFQGHKSVSDQELQWPRDGVYIDCELIDVDVIPEILKKAVAQLVVEQQAGIPLYPAPRTSTSEGFVTEKTVGPLTKKYSSFGAVQTSGPISIPSVEVYLRPLIGCCGNSLRTVRI